MRFRRQLILTQVTIIAALALVIGLILWTYFRSSLPLMEKGVLTKASVCVETLRQRADLAIAVQNRPVLKQALSACAAPGQTPDPDFAFVAVLNAKDELLAHRGHVPPGLHSRGLPAAVRAVRTGDGVRASVQVKIEGIVLGSIWAEYHNHRLVRSKNRFLLLAGLGLGFAVLSSVLSILFIIRLVKPLGGMIAFVKRFAEGDLEARLDVEARDELHELAQNLNRMATQRHRSERSLIDLNEQLQRATAEARRMAREADRASAAKGAFLATMSHEIRTPLNGVLSMLGLVESTPLDEEQQGLVQTARTSAEALLDVINDVLDFSKIEAGKLELDLRDFDLTDVLEGVSQMVAVRAQDKGIDLYCQAGPDLVQQIRGDPTRLRQVLANLLGNAVKFTAEGHVLLRVTQVDRGDATARLRFEVRDTGIGIPANRTDRLFRSFSQVDSSTSRRYGGTGLGLAISKQLVELMGGEIGVESVAGQGATFWFTARFDLPPGKNAARPAGGLPRQLEGRTILVVDDRELGRQTLSAALAEHGLQVRCAEGATSALKALEELDQRCSVVLLKTQLPDGASLELGQRLKRSPAWSAIPVVVLAPLSRAGAAELKHAGISSIVLTCPPTRRALLRCLRDAVSPHSEPRSTVADTALQDLGVERTPQILVAEDNHTNQLVARRLLERLGCNVELAEDGNQAVAMLCQQRFDIVLMDVQMPNKDGIDATREIRASRQVLDPHVPIVAMTAHALKEVQERCLGAGMNEYLTKPFNPETLQHVLRRFLTPAAGGQGASATAGDASAAAGSVPAPVGIDELLARVGGDQELLREVLAVYLESTPGQLEALGAAIAASDGDQAARLAHTIKGASASISAEPMRALAEQCEQQATIAQFDQLRGLHDAMLQQMARIAQIAQQHC